MIDPNDYFGPTPEKAPPETEEEKVAAFKAIKAKLAAADPRARALRLRSCPTRAAHIFTKVWNCPRSLTLSMDRRSRST